MSSARRRPLTVVLSCEHGGNSIPADYRPLFAAPEARRALASHRGWDIGSLPVARYFAKVFETRLYASQTSRLLIELNRSVGHPRLFSEWSRTLPEAKRRRLIDQFYVPYREKIVAAVENAQAAGHRVLHVSVHTFTPVWEEVSRATDVGLLFDPQRRLEADLCAEWQRRLKQASPTLTTHRNRPYRGTSDGLTTSLRRRFPASTYLGIELEVNQRFLGGAKAEAMSVVRPIAECLQRVLAMR